MQLGFFLILKDENFNKAGVGGNQSIIKSAPSKRDTEHAPSCTKRKGFFLPPLPIFSY